MLASRRPGTGGGPGTCSSSSYDARLPNASSPVDGRSAQIDEDARAERERAEVAAWLGLDHAANLEPLGADLQIVADAQAELRQQFGPDERAVSRSSACEYWPSRSVIVP